MSEVRTTSKTGGEKGVKLDRYDLIPVGPLRKLARHFGVGAFKYSDDNWRKGYEWSKSIQAAMRHFEQFRGGEDYDNCPPDGEGCSFVTKDGEPFEGNPGVTCYNHTGSLHIIAFMWHSFILAEFMDIHPEYDDRIKIQKTEEEEEDFNSEIQEEVGRTLQRAFGPNYLGVLA